MLISNNDYTSSLPLHFYDIEDTVLPETAKWYLLPKADD